MTKKDFELIAAVIRRVDRADCACISAIAHDFADALSDTNSRFDAQRFLEACEVEE